MTDKLSFALHAFASRGLMSFGWWDTASLVDEIVYYFQREFWKKKKDRVYILFGWFGYISWYINQGELFNAESSLHTHVRAHTHTYVYVIY